MLVMSRRPLRFSMFSRAPKQVICLNAHDGVSSMTVDRTFLRSFSANVDWLYADLIQIAGNSHGPDCGPGLGGKLLYAGELDLAGTALLVAANIAGAASLTATADAAAQRQAIRDGVIDFLVTALEEALRILKNHIRKGQTVAVCVALPPEKVESEMVELGVLPDLLPPGSVDALRFEAFLDRGARQVNPLAAGDNVAVLTWKVDAAPALWLPKVDSIAHDCLDAFSRKPWPARRWLRQSPGYLGRLAPAGRLLRCETGTARAFLDKVAMHVASGRIGAEVEVCLTSKGRSEEHRFSPPAEAGAPENISLACSPRLQF